jgi:Caspase domain
VSLAHRLGLSPFRLAATLALVVLATVGPARAEEPRETSASFALLIGSNLSVDADLPPLHYADDDAAGYFDLFRLIGARTYLLTRTDDSTRRLHPQAAAEALEPRRAVLDQVVALVAADVAQAHARGLETQLYIAYAGHGGVQNGQGYITLEDARISGSDLSALTRRIPATRVHIIVDACASYSLAFGRGPGGERRPAHGFADTLGLADDPRVGLLLSTSPDGKSHEWEALQAGVFSHEVRSALYGAADVDGDGKVSYREVAAFVERANASIPNARFRPEVHARPPHDSDVLLDVRAGLARRVDIDGAHAGRYLLEDSRGVRLLDLHTSPGQAVHILRPAPGGTAYLTRMDTPQEFAIPPAPDVIAIADLTSSPPRAEARGAASDALEHFFALPFDYGIVDAYRVEPPVLGPTADVPAPASAPASRASLRRTLGWTATGLGVAGLGIGAALSVMAVQASQDASASSSQQTAGANDSRVSNYNTGAVVSYIAGGALLAGGVLTLVWPQAPRVTAAVSSTGGYFGVGGVF